MKKVILIGILSFLLIPGSAFPVTYTFDDDSLLNPYSVSGFNDLFPDSDGVIFDNQVGSTVRGFSILSETESNVQPAFSGNVVFNGTPGQGDTPGTVARFSVPINYVSVTMGDQNGDAETLFLEAYRGTTLLASSSFVNPLTHTQVKRYLSLQRALSMSFLAVVAIFQILFTGIILYSNSAAEIMVEKRYPNPLQCFFSARAF